MKRAIWIVAIISLAASACQGRRFEPSWSISKFRIMGIKATPPELRPTQNTTLSALVEAPGDGPVSYRWEWCPFQTSASNYYECPVKQEDLEEQIASNLPDNVPAELFQFPDFDRGTEPTAEFQYPFPQPLLVAFCEALREQVAQAGEENEELAGLLPTFECDEKFDISVRLVIRNSDQPITDAMLENLQDQDPNEVIVASKKISLWLGSENPQDQNPVVDAVEIRPTYDADYARLRAAGHDWVDEIDDPEEDWYRIPADQPVEILVGAHYELRSLVDPASVQTWARRVPIGSESESEERYQEPQPETLLYNWYTTAGGSFEPPDGFYVQGRNSLDEVSVTDYFVPITDTSQMYRGANGEAFIESCPELEDADPESGCELRLWSVVRDNRRGLEWIDRRLLATGVCEDCVRSGARDEEVDVAVGALQSSESDR
jgi:hypothetical protein